jgi:peptidylprolyl isomerase
MEEKSLKNENNSDNYSYEDRAQAPYIEKRKGDDKLNNENNFQEAITCYAKAILAIKILNDDKSFSKEDIEKYIKEVGIPSNLNISLCYLKNRDWDQVIQHTSKVLEMDKKNVKALYRRCLALINKKKFDKADEDLIELEELIGGSKQLEELESLFEQSKKNVKLEEDKVYKRMFKKYVKGKINKTLK